jgi:hypothetical protein
MMASMPACDLTMATGGHHAHLDLGRIDAVVYRVHPVVCFGWKPGLCCALGDAITLMVSDPWPGGRLDDAAFLAYLTMHARHRAAWPHLVSLDARCRQNASAPEREAVDMMLAAAQAIEDVAVAQTLRTSLTQAGA